MKKPVPVESASALIDEKINELGDWREKALRPAAKADHKTSPSIRLKPYPDTNQLAEAIS